MAEQLHGSPMRRRQLLWPNESKCNSFGFSCSVLEQLVSTAVPSAIRHEGAGVMVHKASICLTKYHLSNITDPNTLSSSRSLESSPQMTLKTHATTEA